MSLLSKSAITTDAGKFIIANVIVANPKPDEVLVKMKATGLCHTDYDSLSWGKPIVMGHEGAGVVETVGSEVTNFMLNNLRILRIHSFYFDNYKNLTIFTHLNLT